MRRDRRGTSSDWATASVLITLMLCIFFAPTGSCNSRNEANLHTEKMEELRIKEIELQLRSVPAPAVERKKGRTR